MENVQVGLGDLEEKVQDEVPRKDEADVILARINADLIALSKIAPLVSFLPCQMDRFADSADGRTWTSSEKMTSTLGCASFSSGIVRWSLKFDVAGTDSFWGLKSASGRECSSLGWNAPKSQTQCFRGFWKQISSRIRQDSILGTGKGCWMSATSWLRYVIAITTTRRNSLSVCVRACVGVCGVWCLCADCRYRAISCGYAARHQAPPSGS